MCRRVLPGIRACGFLPSRRPRSFGFGHPCRQGNGPSSASSQALPSHDRAQELGCARLGADLAAILTERDIFRHGRRAHIAEPDISERVDVLQRRRKEKEPGRSGGSLCSQGSGKDFKQLMRLVPEGRTEAWTNT